VTHAFDELVAGHQHEVLRLCRSIVRDEHLGADAAQETFVRLWKRIADGRQPEHTASWLRKVAVTTALDVARRRAVHRSPCDTDVERLTTQEREPSDGELIARFEDALSELSEGQRTVFLLRHEGRMTLADVAETLDVSLPTVKTQFARACLKLQTKLARFRPENES
jgi:RNA polymerase sigma-70 factor (ECF subfamily)